QQTRTPLDAYSRNSRRKRIGAGPQPWGIRCRRPAARLWPKTVTGCRTLPVAIESAPAQNATCAMSYSQYDYRSLAAFTPAVLLLAMRFILGIGESVALPCGSKILAKNLPEHRRGFASGALMSALKFGNAAGTLGAGVLMAKFGWRPVFIAIGLLSLVWLPAWAKWQPGEAPIITRAVASSPAYAQIFRQKSFWCTTAVQFCCNYFFYFTLTCLPAYLVLDLH